MRLMTTLFSTLLVVASPASARDYRQVSGTAADGTRYYEDSLVIEAPSETLWTAFTDTGAYRRWAAPVSSIDFRIGGSIEASYDPKGRLGDPQNIRNEIVAYVPGRLLAFRNVQAPDGLPGRDVYAKTIKTVEFAAIDRRHTRVTVSGIGFGRAASYDRLYSFFSEGDGAMLELLKRALEQRRP